MNINIGVQLNQPCPNGGNDNHFHFDNITTNTSHNPTPTHSNNGCSNMPSSVLPPRGASSSRKLGVHQVSGPCSVIKEHQSLSKALNPRAYDCGPAHATGLSPETGSRQGQLGNLEVPISKPRGASWRWGTLRRVCLSPSPRVSRPFLLVPQDCPLLLRELSLPPCP